MHQTPTPIPRKAFRSHLPAGILRDFEPAAALDWVDPYALDIKIRCVGRTPCEFGFCGLDGLVAIKLLNEGYESINVTRRAHFPPSLLGLPR